MDGDLHQADLDLAFTFGRSESGAWRDATGTVQTAAADAPRFDHSAAGQARGLLVASGVEPGGGDRLSIDPLILPAGMLLTGVAGADGGYTSDVTVLHTFARRVDDDGGWAVERRAWYSRDVTSAIDALLGQAGHHLALGVVAGFRERFESEAGPFVRFRGEEWQLAKVLLGTTTLPLGARPGVPLIEAGAGPSTGSG